MNLRRLTACLICAVTIAYVTGCESMQGNVGAGLGAVLGGVAGVAAGSAVAGKGHKNEGAAIGGVLGAAAGGVIGHATYDKQKQPQPAK